MLAKRLEYPLVHPLLDLQPDRGAAPQVAQLVLDLLEEVLGLLLVDVEIAVSRDPERMRALQAVSREELARAQLDDVAQEYRPVGTGFRRADRHEPREDARHGENRHVLRRAVVLLGVGALERDNDIEGLVSELGEGMGLVKRQRREHRIDLLAEIRPDPVQLRLRQVVGRAELDALPGERRDEPVKPTVVLVLDHRCGHRVDPAQLLHGRQPVRAELGETGVDLLHQARNPDLEKFVQVGAHDGQEAHALKERMAVALGLLEHPAVEREPAQLAVEIRNLAGLMIAGLFLAGCHWAGCLSERKTRHHPLFPGIEREFIPS